MLIRRFNHILEKYASDALQNDSKILSWAKLSRAKCRWRMFREQCRTERIVEYWVQQTMRATFNADGKPRMQGRGAKRARSVRGVVSIE